MTKRGRRPIMDLERGRLMDFQRCTVDAVMQRMYEDSPPARRFLVADEVGLGKTLVARGIVAHVLDRLWDETDRIDIVYICSNSSIAEQNMRRLMVMGTDKSVHVASADRLTLLPYSLAALNANKVNYIRLTPGTSFNQRSHLGIAEERQLLFRLLREVWGIHGMGAVNLLQGDVGRQRWKGLIRGRGVGLPRAVVTQLARDLQRRGDLRDQFDAACTCFSRFRRSIPNEHRTLRGRVIAALRAQLAQSCLGLLKPRLVIVDEFQRFRDLLDPDSPSGELARSLFDYAQDQAATRTLLLSATPYKMYTRAGEADGEDHYRDFLRTVDFLFGDDRQTRGLAASLERYGTGIQTLHGSDPDLEEMRRTKVDIEGRLRRVMTRTERTLPSHQADNMISTRVTLVTPETRDVEAYVAAQEVADALHQGSVLPYWKSAPYFLSFMDDYAVKRRLEAAVDSNTAYGLGKHLVGTKALFPVDEWKRYGDIDAGNPRLRDLESAMLGPETWRLLWLPPAQPYYQGRRSFARLQQEQLTKRLVFSAWRVVPKALAALLSYKAEREMMLSTVSDPLRARTLLQERRPLLRFARSRGRLTGMSATVLLYPSSVLAKETDPLDIVLALQRTERFRRPTAAAVLREAERRITRHLRDAGIVSAPGAIDHRWYWAAPVLLDAQEDQVAVLEWLEGDNFRSLAVSHADTSEGEAPTGAWPMHVEELSRIVRGEIELGAPPRDLARVLARMALGAPATVAMRTVLRVLPPARRDSPERAYRDAATFIAWGFRTLFSRPEAQALVRQSGSESSYWKRVLEYCIDGNLQAVLDEYGHVLYDMLGLANMEQEDAAQELSQSMQRALNLQAPSLTVDDIRVTDRQAMEVADIRMRTRYCRQFSPEREDDTQIVERAEHVRHAFNSPFWPFVLISTSLGQEGLDFHAYCHAVVHWDLPYNPVDFEQREGRIYRYKGHAVRKNVAKQHEDALLEVRGGSVGDPWPVMFHSAREQRPAIVNDLVPFWVYPVSRGARIESHVLTYRLSRDEEWLAELKRALVVYRMAFGQPRQDDLVKYLLRRVDHDSLQAVSSQLQIDLSPPQLSY